MTIRLFGPWPMAAGTRITVENEQAHYLVHVMRAREGMEVALFNGHDGEWLAEVTSLNRKQCILVVRNQRRPQTPEETDAWLLFAAIKRLRIDFLVEKACELGVSVLWPLFTRHATMTRVNTDRLRAHGIAAAEQCTRLTVPEIRSVVPLGTALADWPEGRRLIVCDESGGGETIADAMTRFGSGPVALLVGPEGGFAKTELDLLRILPFATTVGLGPRVLRAETAALAALACWQALCGDWRR